MADFLEEIAGLDQLLGDDTSLCDMGQSCMQSNCSSSHHDGNEGADQGRLGAPSEGFWQSKDRKLKEILARSLSSGSKVRNEVERALIMSRETPTCQCNGHKKASYGSCTSCLRQSVVDHLRNAGFDAAICDSSWRSTREIPGGKHEYIDVVVHRKDKKIFTRFVVELEFRSEFEMAKACTGYRSLINQLPESYVGKPECLNLIAGVVCDAGKKSMKEMRLHMGPWRKKQFMQMKWSAPYKRLSSDQPQTFPVESKDSQVPVVMIKRRFWEAPALQVG